MTFRENIAPWKKFPNVQTLGYYHSLGNYIALNDIEDETEFTTLKKNPSSNRNKFSVYIHELQHYYDQVSTLWGAQNIYKIYRAFDSMLKQKEEDFYKSRDLTLTLQRDSFYDYYTTLINPIHGSYATPWKYQITLGCRFDHKGEVNKNWPIPFISFSSNKNNLITRVPISVVSLLETTATFAEYNFKMKEIQKLHSPYKDIQTDRLSKEFERKLYNPELALYSAAVHLASVHLNITDPLIGYKISSLFAKTALNIPSSLFSTIPIPEEFKKDQDWLERCNKLQENQDRGFAYYLLIKNYANKFGKLNGNSIPIDDVLTASNLPKEDKIMELIQSEIDKLDYDVLTEQNNFTRLIIDKIFFGNKFRESTGIGQQNDEVDLSEFIREEPFLIFNSTYFEYENLDLKPIIEKLTYQQEISREEWFRFHTHFEKKMDEFDTICGI